MGEGRAGDDEVSIRTLTAKFRKGPGSVKPGNRRFGRRVEPSDGNRFALVQAEEGDVIAAATIQMIAKVLGR
jgi:hypothetical protein